MKLGNTWRYMLEGQTEFTYVIVDLTENHAGLTAKLEVTRQGFTDEEYQRWSGENLISFISEGEEDQSLELTGPLYEGRHWRKLNTSTETTTYYTDSEVTGMEYPVNVPAGEFSTMVVREITHSEFPPLPPSIDTSYVYYARDIGIVKWNQFGLEYLLLEFIESDPGETTGNGE